MDKKPNYDSRTADKFVVRLATGQRDRLKARAKADHQSMNDAVLTAIDKHLDQGAAFDELLRILQKAIQPQGGAFVSIRRDYLQQLLRAVMDADEEGLAQHSEAMIAALAVLGGEL